MEPKLILHGGIESFIDDEEKSQKQEALERICQISYDYLMRGNALDAVEFAIKMLEDNALFNAGTGSIFQKDGIQRMDASIMDGHTIKAGTVAQVYGVKNPIAVARLVMEETSHIMLVGEGALQFARIKGIEIYPTLTELALKKWLRINQEPAHGTVGAVAIDKYGHMAAATSTGGWATSLPGRVGDVAVIGAGTYANKYVGVSCTGHGEKILAINLSRLVSFYVEEGHSLRVSAEKSLEKLRKLDGVGGFIAVGFNGDFLATATQGAYMPVSSMPKY